MIKTAGGAIITINIILNKSVFSNARLFHPIYPARV